MQSFLNIHWNINPEIFRIGGFGIRYYSLMFGMAFLFSYLILSKMYKRENVSIQLLDKLAIFIVLGTLNASAFWELWRIIPQTFVLFIRLNARLTRYYSLFCLEKKGKMKKYCLKKLMCCFCLFHRGMVDVSFYFDYNFFKANL